MFSMKIMYYICFHFCLFVCKIPITNKVLQQMMLNTKCVLTDENISIEDNQDK